MLNVTHYSTAGLIRLICPVKHTPVSDGVRKMADMGLHGSLVGGKSANMIFGNVHNVDA